MSARDLAACAAFTLAVAYGLPLLLIAFGVAQ